jgi:hypothetical protein
VLQVKVNLAQGEFMGHLRVSSNVPNALVYLDDPTRKKEPWGKTPHSEKVAIGEHSLLLQATGYEPTTQKLVVDRGEQKELKVRLERLRIGGLRVTSNAPQVSVTLDGRPVGTYSKSGPPLELRKLASGTHHLRILANGRKPLEATVQIPRGQILPVHAHLVVLPPRGAAYAQAIIGGVLLGGGIYLGLESNRLHDELELDRSHRTLANDDSRALRGKIYSISADVAFLGAGVLAGVSTYNFLHDPLPPSRLVVKPPVEFDSPNRAGAARAKGAEQSWWLPGSTPARLLSHSLAACDVEDRGQP